MRERRCRKWLVVTFVLVACLAVAIPVLAQVSANYDLSWHVIGGGGGRMMGTQHTLQGTIGQPVIGPEAGSGHTLCSGFWCGAADTGYWVYLPLVLRDSH
jgi:hypothetical protein